MEQFGYGVRAAVSIVANDDFRGPGGQAAFHRGVDVTHHQLAILASPWVVGREVACPVFHAAAETFGIDDDENLQRFLLGGQYGYRTACHDKHYHCREKNRT